MAKPKKKYSNLSKDEIKFILNELHIRKVTDIDTAILKNLKEKLKALKDTRYHKMIIYKLWDVIICVIIASFAFNNTWADIHQFVKDNYKWFKSFLQMTGGVPTANSYERIISLIDSEELNNLLLDFFSTIIHKKINNTVKQRNFDGRVNNGSSRKASLYCNEITSLNSLNVYDSELGYCITSKEIDSKTNEIPNVEILVKGMDLKGIIATWDALNTQTKNVEAVINAGGDYTAPVKGNQEVLYQDLIDYFDEDKCDEIKAGNLESQYLSYIEKSHSSIIEYQLYQTSDIKWYDRINDWKAASSFGLVRKIITKNTTIKEENKKKKNIETTTIENRYYISSRNVNIKEFNEVTRGQWNVENKIHWQLDFTFEQDKNKTINKKALLNLEIIHKFVLAILERVKPYYDKNTSLKSIRKHLSNNIEEYFSEFIVYLTLASK